MKRVLQNREWQGAETGASQGSGGGQVMKLDWKVSGHIRKGPKHPAQELGGTGEPWTGFEQGQAWPALTCGEVPGPVWQVDCSRRDRRASLLLVGRWNLITEEEVGLH